MRKFSITVNGKTYSVDVEEVGSSNGASQVSTPVSTPVSAPEPQKAAPVQQGSQGANKVSSPMPGTIVSVKVSVGEQVKDDTLVAVLEAMKMENEILAGCSGTVASVNVSSGDSVNTGDVIITIN